jgi:acylphosphatase
VQADDRRRVHLWISGRVQGVFYRATARDQARALGLAGWVRNLPDGRVEVRVEGTPRAIESFVDHCRRGPAGAEVTDVEVVDEPPAGDLRGFTVR